MGIMGSAPATGEEAREASDGSRITSSAVCPTMLRAPVSSKMAAQTTPLTRVCPSLISVFEQSVFEVDGLIVAIEFERRRALFLGAKTRFLAAAERQLVFHARAGQVHGQQAGF